MKYLLIITLASFIHFSYGQELSTFDHLAFLRDGKEVPKVLLVGTFHFNYPNLDKHKIAKEDQVDIQSAQKQREVMELIDYLAQFKPTKIVVERWPQSNANEKYHQYLKGEYDLKNTEIDQLAFRLGKMFGVDDLVLADAGTLVRDFIWSKDSLCLRPIMDSIYQDWDFSDPNDPMDKKYDALYELEDKMESASTLLDVFKYNNSRQRMLTTYGAYLVGDISLGEHRGADALSMHWYNRNLRIFKNIRDVEVTAEDRIMVIYGSGHMGILHNLFESSPEYDLIDFNALGK